MTGKMSADTAEEIIKLALKAGADDAVTSVWSSHLRQARFTKNKVFLSSDWMTLSGNLFVAVKGRTLSTALNSFSKKELEKNVERAVKTARLLEPNRDYFGVAEGPFKYKKVARTYDGRIKDADLADAVHAAVNAALAEGARTAAGVTYAAEAQEWMASSNNVHADEKASSIELSVRAFREKDESGHSVSCGRMLSDFSPSRAGEEAGRIAKQAAKPLALQAGKYDVVFGRLAAANLLNNIGDACSALAVEAGFSFFAERLGRRVAAGGVTLFDDATVPAGFRSAAFDEEGVPTQRNALIDRGVLKTFLHNTSTAKKFGVKTTANAGIAAPRVWNLVLRPGGFSDDELFREVRNGLYVTNVWYTRFQNYRTGDFSTIPRDGMFVIKNGEISQAVKNLRVSDNLLRMLENVRAVGRERRWVRCWDAETPVLCAPVLVKDTGITKPTL